MANEMTRIDAIIDIVRYLDHRCYNDFQKMEFLKSYVELGHITEKEAVDFILAYDLCPINNAKKAHWEVWYHGSGESLNNPKHKQFTYSCSNCGHHEDEKWKHCPACGAVMEEAVR